MTIYRVLDTMTVNQNTSIVIEGNGELLKNGVGVLDDNGKPYEVLSVAMVSDYDNMPAHDRTMLLVEGAFSSKKIFI